MAGRRMSSSSSSRHAFAGPQSPTTTIVAGLSKLFPRRTYSSAKVRTFALVALAAVSILASTIVLHAWLFPSSRYLQQQQQQQHQFSYQQRPAAAAARQHSRAFRTETSSASAYSFAAHPTYELGALVGFLAALASNSLPLSVDPAAHIDPELVLGFDTRAGDAKVQDEVAAIVQDTWAHNPVVIFSELRSPVAPASREAKTILDHYHLYPAPTVFEVDRRVDAAVLRPLLKRLTGATALPVVLVNGQPIASLDALRAAHADGSLTQMLSASGATIDGALLRRKKGHR